MRMFLICAAAALAGCSSSAPTELPPGMKVPTPSPVPHTATAALAAFDEAPDEERQHLLPFVTRLACADTPTVERERDAYIAARMRWRLPLREGIRILEGALAIGRQAEVGAPEEVRAWMAGVQQQAATPTSVDEHPLFAKTHGWLVGIV